MSRVVLLDDACIVTWEKSFRTGYAGPGWYFWDESYANLSGPFVDRVLAERSLGEYADALEIEREHG
jgi:hypothetical protein